MEYRKNALTRILTGILFRYAVRRLPLDAFPAAAREHPPHETPPPPSFDELEPPPSYEDAVGLRC